MDWFSCSSSFGFRSLHLSSSYRLFFPLFTSPSLLSVCRFLPMLFSPPPPRPAFSSISLPRGRLERIPRVWLLRRYLEDCGLLAGDRGGRGGGRICRKSSELSAHQILVGGMLGQILRAELSSNAYPRVLRTNPPSRALIKSRSEGSSDKSSELSSHQMPVGGSTGRSYSAIHRTWR